eukprot:294183-Rhodomonas_salina.1
MVLPAMFVHEPIPLCEAIPPSSTFQAFPASCLRARYAMSGTDLAYALSSPSLQTWSSGSIAYGPTTFLGGVRC